MAMRSISELTWRDALLIELDSLRDRVDRHMPVQRVTKTRLAGLIDEYEQERTTPKGSR
jgi:hypothetical protein